MIRKLKRCKVCDCFVSHEIIYDYTKTFGWRKYIKRECECIKQVVLLDRNPQFHWLKNWNDFSDHGGGIL